MVGRRLGFVLIGIAISSIFFAVFESSLSWYEQISTEPFHSSEVTHVPRRVTFELYDGLGHANAGLAKRVGARFLLTSTSEVYGDPLQHPQVETYWGNVNPIGKLRLINILIIAGGRIPNFVYWTDRTGVRSCYDEGKRVAETLAMDYHRGLSVEVRIARIFNTYGPRMCLDDGRVVSNFVAQALRKEPLTVYGDGKQTRSFQYVSDLVEGLMRLMEGRHVGPFNLGNPGEFTMLELAEVVQETIDPNAKIEYRPNTEDDPHKRKPDISKAKELLGWEPKVSLREGLPLMVSDFRKRIFADDSSFSSQ